ncbi:hypothetical protein CLPU_15c00660 [Gottschalkia purinilytica]|uniref:Uncharacterized protein n=1 Tax=Gottschalkia purinilytica TaxID=1503 RepID=A0A0L0W807_GOTPU|nr:hypothetical protein [Gottschalkia purinilytica]KNF07572.1 hypothetical protein CLPU_15c00660 [Gottschalkia purinilytica]
MSKKMLINIKQLEDVEAECNSMTDGSQSFISQDNSFTFVIDEESGNIEPINNFARCLCKCNITSSCGGGGGGGKSLEV